MPDAQGLVLVRDLHHLRRMRSSATLLTALVFWVPVEGWAQEARIVVPARLVLDAPAATARPALTVADVDTASAASQRLSEEIYRRLEPVQQRFQRDDRLRRVGAMFGLGAIAFGVMRGGRPLTFVGTEALRLGFERQLTQTAPSIGPGPGAVDRTPRHLHHGQSSVQLN